MNKSVFPVFSFNLMKYLDRLGFKFFDARPNSRIEGKVVFYFDNNPDLQAAVEKYNNTLKD